MVLNFYGRRACDANSGLKEKKEMDYSKTEPQFVLPVKNCAQCKRFFYITEFTKVRLVCIIIAI